MSAEVPEDLAPSISQFRTRWSPELSMAAFADEVVESSSCAVG
ncbi:hypothetical protein [Bradyrhizobium sp. LTSP857]|nr:hypothetical protein [Bradyrhizobium sp. LTSP857]